jgi:hypothetical protein
VQHRWNGVGRGQRVAGVDDQVGLEVGECPDPRVLAPLPRGDVQIGHVQEPDRVGAGRQDRDVEEPHREGVALDQSAVQRGRARCRAQNGQCAAHVDQRTVERR